MPSIEHEPADYLFGLAVLNKIEANLSSALDLGDTYLKLAGCTGEFKRAFGLALLRLQHAIDTLADAERHLLTPIEATLSGRSEIGLQIRNLLEPLRDAFHRRSC